MHTYWSSILYTVECALLFVIWMTLPSPVTATRRVPSGDHATPYTLMWCQKKKGLTGTYRIITLRSVHLFLRGNVDDAECQVKTAGCHQRAVGRNRTRQHLHSKQNQTSTTLQAKENKRTRYECNLQVAFLTSCCALASICPVSLSCGATRQPLGGWSLRMWSRDPTPWHRAG